MIVEYFKYLTNPASDSAKILGHLHESIGLEARYKRSQRQWNSHLTQSKSFIKNTSLPIKNPKDVIVLGSGLLLDIPIEFLAQYFNRVILVDVVHLKKTKKRIKQYKNVVAIEHDVTGISTDLPNNMKKKFKLTPSIPHLSEQTSLVISANLLSQLSLSFTKYAEKHLNYDDDALQKLATAITKSHVNMLSELDSQVCLISDVTHTYQDLINNQGVIETAIADVELPEPDQSWNWEIAPKGELGQDISMTSVVNAYKNFKI